MTRFASESKLAVDAAKGRAGLREPLMSWKLRVLVPAILAAPQAAFALGLGDIRLNSALNEPLSAEIDLVAVAADEVDTVRAQLAPRELFDRYGLDRPSYLDTVSFRVGKGRDGRSVLLVRSAAPIGEPFVTFLVELNWPRGKLLREYTVLLDPPVFTPAEPARAAAVATPRVVSQPAAARAPAPVAEPVSAEPPAAPAGSAAPSVVHSMERPDSYPVQRNDTLYQIAAQLTGGNRRETQRMMIALFRANARAFDGNINRLQQGAVLRVPGPDDVAAIGAGEAAREISRQTAEWRGSVAAPAEPETGRLKLVTPQEQAAPAGAAAEAAQSAASARVRQLEQELVESRRLLELKSAELAALQHKLSGAAAPAPATAAPPPAREAATPENAPPAPEAAPPAVEPAAAPPKKPRKKKSSPPTAEAAEPSLLDRVTGNWQYLVGAAAVVLVGLLGFGFLRRRREDEFEEPFGTAGAAAPAYGAAQVRTAGAESHPSIVVEERAASEPVAGVRPEDTFSSESAVNIDHSDPLAEADFHMAYGLHDQAADLIKLALEKEPNRRDLKNKLLEVYFVWGNKDRFLEVARDLQSTRQDAAPGEWERIVIMGRQIAPEHAMFAGTLSTAAMGAMDVNLEGGQTRVDVELMSPPPAAADADGGIDLDLGQALGERASEDETGHGELLDLDVGGPAPGNATAELPTIEMPRPAERTAELPTVEMPASDVASTAEQPQLDRSGETIRESFSLPAAAAIPAVDATAELSVDDLGIDLGELEALGATNEAQVPGIDDTSTMLTQISEADDATRFAPHIEEALGAVEQDSGRTEVLPQLPAGGDVSEFEPTQVSPVADTSATEFTHVLETTAEKPTLDFDLSDSTLAEPIDMSMAAGPDAGSSESGHTERIDITEMPQLSDLEPVTLSEVGTKLDLARAYMDMGDPDGARSILQEVLSEGSASQKQEAQRLLDALPGNA